MERLFCTKEFLQRELEQCDDAVRCVLVYYIPLFNVEIEQILIDRLCRSTNRHDFSERLIKTLTNRHMILDPQLKNDRLVKLIDFLGTAPCLGELEKVKKIGLFYTRAYLHQPDLLLKLLGLPHFMETISLHLIPSIIQDTHTYVMCIDKWFTVRAGMTKIGLLHMKEVSLVLNYCLSERMEEPVLEWIAFKHVKGGDLVEWLVKNYYIWGPEKEFYESLKIKYQSDEMRERRMNVLFNKKYKNT